MSGATPFYCPVKLRFCVRSNSCIVVRFRPIFADFGTSTITTDDATNLFEIIEDRTEINSTIITSQLPVSNWYNYLNNDTVADAILDRIIHSSHRIELEGESMRKLRSKINKI